MNDNNYEKIFKLSGVQPRKIEKTEGPHYVSKLRKIAEYANNAANLIESQDMGELEYWIQDKIVIAEHNMEAINEYLGE